MKGIFIRSRAVMLASVGGWLLLTAGCERKESEAANPERQEEAAPSSGAAVEGPVGVVEPERGSQPGPAAETQPEARPAPRVKPEKVKARWTIEDAGFARRLPQDVDLYAGGRKLEAVWEWVAKSGGREELEKFLKGPSFEEGVPKDYRELIGRGVDMLPVLFGEEVFVAGRGLAWSMETGMGANVLMYRALGEAIAGALASGDLEAFGGEDFPPEILGKVGPWIQKKIEEAGGQPQVAIYLGGRVEDEKRGEVMALLRKVLATVAEKEDPKAIEFEQAGCAWTGFEIVINELEGFDLDGAIPEGVRPTGWKELMTQIGAWKVVVACTEVDGYVVIAAGNGKESIVLAEAPEKALAGREEFKFFSRFEAEAVVATGWTSKELVEGVNNFYTYLPFFEGAEKALGESKGLKRGAELVKALAQFNAHWKERRAGTAHEWLGAVLIGDEVLAEARGGWAGAGLDLAAPLKLAKAFEGLEQEPFIRAHWKMKSDYVEGGHRQVDAGIRFLRLVAEEALEVVGESAEGEGDDKAAGKYGRWSRDLVNGLDDIWSGYRDHFAKALGEESAFVMDLRGKMIAAVGVEEAVLKKGRIPRAALVRPVVKREALTESWKIWNGALTNMFGIMAEAMEQPIPFPDTMTAEKDDLRTYFFPFPFASDDFLPSVSVSDELLILGTSKTLSEALYESTREGKGAPVEAGVRIEVKMDGLWDFCEAWLEVFEARRAAAEAIEEDELLEEEPADVKPGAKAADARKEVEQLLEQAKALKAAGETEIPKELLDALNELEIPEEIDEAAKKLEELKDLLEGVQPTREQPVLPGEPEIPKADVENPLLKELLKKPEGGPPGLEDGPAFELNPAESVEPGEDLEEGDEDIQAKRVEVEGLAGPTGLELPGFPEPVVLRSILEKARLFRGLRYRRWSEGGVPRSSLRVDWSAP